MRDRSLTTSLSLILRARCPKCKRGHVLQGWVSIRKSCERCGYDFYPEPGFYLGAMAISFLLTAMLTVPPMIALKLLNVELAVLIAFPFVEYLFVGGFLMFYSRIAWLHLEHRLRGR